MSDPRLAALATVPERVVTLPLVLRSLRPQVDELYVVLNDYKKIPPCVSEYDCAVLLARGRFSGWGAAGKFWPFWDSQEPAWRLTCDDDFVYRAGYVEHLVSACGRLDAPVSLHGVVLSDALRDGRPVNAWDTDGRARRMLASDHVTEDTRVHLLGTGVACHHSSHVRLRQSDFEEPNSADIWFAKACREQGVQRYVPQHPKELARVVAPPLRRGPLVLRRSGDYVRHIVEAGPWGVL